MKDDDQPTRLEALFSMASVALFPFSALWMGREKKDKTDKPKSDALSTCGCLIGFVAIILLIAVCAA